ncbi:MAG: glycosyltransferase [Vicinamibacterales bacterium]
MSDLRIFVGCDSREPVAAAVLMHSILARASAPVALYPLTLASVAHAYTRERTATESTEFSFTRFLVPYLSRYEGWSVFMDCDMLCQVDLWEALAPHVEAQQEKAVLVCPHDYVPKTSTKMDGRVQTVYPRKNWSSLMVFNNAKCRALTRQYVNTVTGGELHQFAWVPDKAIGTLPLTLNWLVGEYRPRADAEILHYTLGGPYMAGHERCDHADLWNAERDRMLQPKPSGWMQRLGLSA